MASELDFIAKTRKFYTCNILFLFLTAINLVAEYFPYVLLVLNILYDFFHVYFTTILVYIYSCYYKYIIFSKNYNFELLFKFVGIVSEYCNETPCFFLLFNPCCSHARGIQWNPRSQQSLLFRGEMD